jgi:hypothetical protein
MTVQERKKDIESREKMSVKMIHSEAGISWFCSVPSPRNDLQTPQAHGCISLDKTIAQLALTMPILGWDHPLSSHVSSSCREMGVVELPCCATMNKHGDVVALT